MSPVLHRTGAKVAELALATVSKSIARGADMSLQRISTALVGALAVAMFATSPALAQKRPNVVMLMTDDTGWNDFGAYTGGGAALGHPTPNIDRIAKEGALFTSWYGQASCTAGGASFITGLIPIRSALSSVVAPCEGAALN